MSSTTLSPPEWYSRLPRGNSRPTGKGSGSSSSADTKLGQLKRRIENIPKVARGSHLPDNECEALINILHDAMFYDVNAQMVRNHNLLTTTSGLPVLFYAPSSKGMAFPSYIMADAEELYTKWCDRNFEPDMLRGLRMDTQSRSMRMKTDFQRPRKGDVYGHNSLVNGQWWPLQICLVRDGAHSDMQGGISGKTNQGAWSIVLSAGNRESGGVYPNIDKGDILHYCGTDAKQPDGAVTENTKRMIESYQLKKPVRVFRSSKAPNKEWAPDAGFRYDGLYDVDSYTTIDEKTQCHRFKMIRQAGQDPIRNSGPERRPTTQEKEHWLKNQKDQKYIVSDG